MATEKQTFQEIIGIDLGINEQQVALLRQLATALTEVDTAIKSLGSANANVLARLERIGGTAGEFEKLATSLTTVSGQSENLVKNFTAFVGAQNAATVATTALNRALLEQQEIMKRSVIGGPRTEAAIRTRDEGGRFASNAALSPSQFSVNEAKTPGYGGSGYGGGTPDWNSNVLDLQEEQRLARQREARIRRELKQSTAISAADPLGVFGLNDVSEPREWDASYRQPSGANPLGSIRPAFGRSERVTKEQIQQDYQAALKEDSDRIKALRETNRQAQTSMFGNDFGVPAQRLDLHNDLTWKGLHVPDTTQTSLDGAMRGRFTGIPYVKRGKTPVESRALQFPGYREMLEMSADEGPLYDRSDEGQGVMSRARVGWQAGGEYLGPYQRTPLARRMSQQTLGLNRESYDRLATALPDVTRQFEQQTLAGLTNKDMLKMVADGSMTTAEMQHAMAQRTERSSSMFNSMGRHMLSSIIIGGLMWGTITKLSEATGALVTNLMAVSNASAIAAYTTGRSINEMSTAAQSAMMNGAQYGIAPTDSLNAFVQATRFTKDAAEQQDLLSRSAQLSVLTGDSQANSMQRLVTISRQWGMSLNDTQRILDVTAVALRETGVSLDQFVEAMAEGSVTGQLFGLSLEQTSGLLAGIMTATGSNSPSKSVTLLERMAGIDKRPEDLKRLADMPGVAPLDIQGNLRPIPDLLAQINAQWKNWNNEQRQSAGLALAGSRQLSEFTAMMNNYDLLITKQKEFANSSGEADKAIAASFDSIQKQAERVMPQIGALITQSLTPSQQVYDEWMRFFELLSGKKIGDKGLLGELSDNLTYARKEYGVSLPDVLGDMSGLNGLDKAVWFYSALASRVVSDRTGGAVRDGVPDYLKDRFAGQREAQDATGKAAAQPYGGKADAAVTKAVTPTDQAISNYFVGRVNTQAASTDFSYAHLMDLKQRAESESTRRTRLMAEQAADDIDQIVPMDAPKRAEFIAGAIAKMNEAGKHAEKTFQSFDGRLVTIKGNAADVVQELMRMESVRLPGLQITDMSSDQLAHNQTAALAMASQYEQAIHNSNLPLEQQTELIRMANEQWKQTSVIVGLVGGQFSFVNGRAAAFLSQAQQVNRVIKPIIQAEPDLTPERARTMQGNLTQYENLFRRMGVQQDPQQYLLFGQNGSMFKFVTSSEAMTMAMNLLREQVQQNNDNLKDQLRGHYNIPTDWGYVPPTPWEYYDRTGSQEMGPINYPWNFKDKDEKSYLNGVPTGDAQFLQTTMGSGVVANSIATTTNTSALNNNTSAINKLIASMSQSQLNSLSYGQSQALMGASMRGDSAQSNVSGVPYADLINSTAAKYGIPPVLLAGIIKAESGFNASSINKTSGAVGLGQVMPSDTHIGSYDKTFAGRPTTRQLLDPATNIDWSARILSGPYQKHGADINKLAESYFGKGTDAQGTTTNVAAQRYLAAINSLGGLTNKPLPVQGMPQLTSTMTLANSTMAQVNTHTSLTAAYTSQGAARMVMSITTGNALLARANSLLGQIATTVGKPPVVNVTVQGIASGSSGNGGGSSTTQQSSQLGIGRGVPGANTGAYVR